MKHIILFTIVLVLSVFSASAKKQKVEKLEWDMTYEKFCKKFDPKLKIDEELFSIVYLPKDSIFGNEYYEYLLFGKYEDSKKKLIKRLQLTNSSEDEIRSKIRLLYSNEAYIERESNLSKKLKQGLLEYDSFDMQIITDRELLDASFDVFPSLYSEQAIFLLMDYVYDFAICSSNSFDDEPKSFHSKESDENEYCVGLFMNGHNYLLRGFEEWNAQHYFSQEIKDYIPRLITDFVKNSKKILESKMQNTYQKKAPFGSFFGMRANLLYLIAAKDKYGNYAIESSAETDLGTLADKVDYKDFYSLFEYAGKTTVKKFVPNKSADFVSEYYGVFDSNEKGLYQFFSIVNFDRTTDVKKMYENDNKNKNAFNKVKAILTEQYGEPQKKDEMSLYWITSDNVKIELFGESKVVKLWSYYYGKEVGGYDDYTCLVYTDLDVYNSLCTKEQEMRENEAQKAKKAQEEKENQQKSYF